MSLCAAGANRGRERRDQVRRLLSPAHGVKDRASPSRRWCNQGLGGERLSARSPPLGGVDDAWPHHLRQGVSQHRARGQQPPSARCGCPRSRPPHHGLCWAQVSATGKPQVLAALLGLCWRRWGKESGAIPDVDDARRPRRVVEEDRLGVVGISPAPTGRGSRRSGTRTLAAVMVRTWTASAAGLRRRCAPRRSCPRPTCAICWRNHDVSAVAPICSVVAAACRSWPTWRRSVS
jgi:hypothetical protein